MQDLEVVDPLDAVFASVASLTTADVTPKADRSERIEIYDSGATCHMSPYIEAFANFEFITPKPISAANNQTFEAVGKGRQGWPLYPHRGWGAPSYRPHG